MTVFRHGQLKKRVKTGTRRKFSIIYIFLFLFITAFLFLPRKWPTNKSPASYIFYIQCTTFIIILPLTSVFTTIFFPILRFRSTALGGTRSWHPLTMARFLGKIPAVYTSIHLNTSYMFGRFQYFSLRPARQY